MRLTFLHPCFTVRHMLSPNLYRGADKSLARPGKKQARKHVRDASDFNNIETRAVIKFFFPPTRQGAEGNLLHSDRNICLYSTKWRDNQWVLGLINIKVVVVFFMVPSGYFVGGTEKKHKNPQFPTAGLLSEILIVELDGTNRKFKRFESDDVQSRHIKHRLKYSRPQLKRPRSWRICIIPQIFHKVLSASSTSVIPVSDIYIYIYIYIYIGISIITDLSDIS